mgnify:FL=1
MHSTYKVLISHDIVLDELASWYGPRSTMPLAIENNIDANIDNDKPR